MLVFLEFHSTKYLKDLGLSRIEHRLLNKVEQVLNAINVQEVDFRTLVAENRIRNAV
jgi:hypothetical protein